MSAKILIIDIETAPIVGYLWGLHDQNISLDQIISPSYMLSYSAKWLDKSGIIFDSIFNHKEEFKKDPKNEESIAKTAWVLMNEADIIIAHNGDGFDIKWLNTIFLKHGLKPVSPFKTIDTLKIARSHFKFPSNKLDYIAQALGVGSKLRHEGFKLWDKCIRGDEQAWKKMEQYNKRDVFILEKVYKKLRPFIKNHPNLALYNEEENPTCPNCNGKKFNKRGFAYTAVSKYHRYVCCNCGKWVRGRQNLLSKDKANNTFNNYL